MERPGDVVLTDPLQAPPCSSGFLWDIPPVSFCISLKIFSPSCRMPLLHNTEKQKGGWYPHFHSSQPLLLGLSE